MNRIKATTGLLIIALAAAPAWAGLSSERESAGAYLGDSVVTTRIKSAFLTDKAVHATKIGVETNQGNVQLSGFAANEGEKERAEAIARSVPGVKTVSNDIRIK